FSFFFMASIAMIFVINLSDKEVRERDYFFVTAYNLWAFWMGIGSIYLIRMFKNKNKIICAIVAAVMLALPAINLASQYFIHDRSKDFIALDYGLNILNSLEENAIVFTNGDNDTFPLWYAQAVKDKYALEIIRPATNTSPTPKTLDMISIATEYKKEEIFGIRTDVSVANLSLLNTPWYIRQLRDKEGIEFNMTEKQIDEIRPTLVVNRNNIDAVRHYYSEENIDVIAERRISIKDPLSDQTIEIFLKEKDFLQIKDLAVLRIIQDNFGKRPIYFAVTIPDSEISYYKKYLSNEGMVDRMVSTAMESQINIEALSRNLDEIYSYRSIFDDSVYKDNNVRRLISNYAAAYLRASNYYYNEGDIPNAINYMEKTIDFDQQKDRYYIGISQLHEQAGNLRLAYTNIQKAIEIDPTNDDYFLQAGKLLLLMESDEAIDIAFQLFENALIVSSNKERTAAIIYRFAVESDTFEKANELINKHGINQKQIESYFKK
ncbi:MAG: hypothetical protein PHR06_06240, partial [Candidatus Cloacimonetes bacterium]|nr:hypothetical protein [Candidatus Cloacimonadota bacterium]